MVSNQIMAHKMNEINARTQETTALLLRRG